MLEISHHYSLSPEWQKDVVQGLNATLIDNKIIVIPKKYGQGHTYFIEVMEGISVLLLDFTLTIPIKINRMKSDNKLFIIQYDLSDEVNLLQFGSIEHKIGYSVNLGLAVVDNQMSNTFIPVVGRRTFAVRLLVDKKLISASIGQANPSNNYNGKLFFFDHIHSKNRLILHSLKSKSMMEESFDYYIKGIALKLLANFIEKYSSLTSANVNATDQEIKALIITKDYLIENLLEKFPSVSTLSGIAGISLSKYKILFKKLFLITPKGFFIREKMFLAEKMLRSGKFSTITEVVHELNYVKLSYFSLKYLQVHCRKPSIDFVSNRTPKI